MYGIPGDLLIKPAQIWLCGFKIKKNTKNTRTSASEGWTDFKTIRIKVLELAS